MKPSSLSGVYKIVLQDSHFAYHFYHSKSPLLKSINLDSSSECHQGNHTIPYQAIEAVQEAKRQERGVLKNSTM